VPEADEDGVRTHIDLWQLALSGSKSGARMHGACGSEAKDG
jgi:hypothetical protein